MVNNERIMELITTRVQDATWVMSVCTGAGVLASTGLIDNYNAT
jgi:transcriptional regulator GlxA family with amidase domain